MWQKIDTDGGKYLDLAPGLRVVVYRDGVWWWCLEARGEAGEDTVILRGEAQSREADATAGALDAVDALGRMVLDRARKGRG